ncbi:hypothetical protein KJ885_02025, partial [Patescibacteria group bacterium]|nr:hypothetical protein [Patescibacteria group bacterium]
MIGAVWAINPYKRQASGPVLKRWPHNFNSARNRAKHNQFNPARREEAKVFKGTLLGIVVSFLLLVFFAFLLNLAESYWYLNKNIPAQEAKFNADRAISGGEVFDEGFVGWHRILGVKTAHAATYARSDYKATLLLRSASNLELSPGEEIIYRVGFKNTGDAVWSNEDRNFISIYTYTPKYRTSLFQGSGWYLYNQPAKLRETQVNAGGLGFIEFKIKAPVKEGNYIETFHLAAEDKTWIEGGEFSIPITVQKTIKQENGKIVVQNNSPPATGASLIPTTNSNFQASLL